MTDYERAMFRLAVWSAITGWGTSGDPKAKDLADRLGTAWNWEERMKKADELAAWAIKAPPT